MSKSPREHLAKWGPGAEHGLPPRAVVLSCGHVRQNTIGLVGMRVFCAHCPDKPAKRRLVDGSWVPATAPACATIVGDAEC